MDPWVSLATLDVRDLERSRRFCRDGLGWPMSSAGTEDITFFPTGGVQGGNAHAKQWAPQESILRRCSSSDLAVA
jgi:hypothetical protein